MRVRRATVKDAMPIAAVHVASWQRAYAHLLPHSWLDALSTEARGEKWNDILAGHHGVAVAVDQNAVVGFVSGGPCRDADAEPGTYEVFALYVEPRKWRAGLGSKLLSWSFSEALRTGAKRMSLWIIVGNERASAFYRKHGFSLEPGSRQPFTIAGAELHEDRYIRLLPANGA